MSLRGHAKGLLHLNAGPGHTRLQHGRNCRRAVANGASRFTVGADHKTRLINKAQNRQMKAVAEINKTAKFLRGGGCHGAA